MFEPHNIDLPKQQVRIDASEYSKLTRIVKYVSEAYSLLKDKTESEYREDRCLQLAVATAPNEGDTAYRISSVPTALLQRACKHRIRSLTDL